MQAEPKSPYAHNKLADEVLLDDYAQKGALRTVALRYFNVFGPKQDPHSPYAAAMPHFINQAVAHQDITIFGDGEQTRDFIFVEDVAQVNLLAAESGSGIYNVAHGQAISITDLAKKIKEQLDSQSSVVYSVERAGDIKHSRANANRLRQQWPNICLYPFDKALAKTIQYYMSR